MWRLWQAASAGGPAPAMDLRSATPFALTADLDAPADTLLHLASFSFPGWQVTLDGVNLDDSGTRTTKACWRCRCRLATTNCR